jgi:hypothetical protein
MYPHSLDHLDIIDGRKDTRITKRELKDLAIENNLIHVMIKRRLVAVTTERQQEESIVIKLPIWH